MTRGIKPDIQPDRLRKLLKELVDIYSPSGKEKEILEYTHNYLEQHGLVVVKQVVDENRYNLLVLPEKEQEMMLCFVGHLDTVTAYDLDDYGFHKKGDDIFGLGTADMKAGCAAMIEAFTVLVEGSRALPPAGLALVIDEEEDNSGAKTLLKEYQFPWAIIGEPTALAPCLGHYAYLEVLLRTQGLRAHSAVPEMGQNAIENMLRLLLQFSEHLNSRKDGLVYNIRDMKGFPGGFVVPDVCETWLDLHLPPGMKIDSLKKELRQLIKVAKNQIPELDASLEFESTYHGYQVGSEEYLVTKLRRTYRKLSLPWEPREFRSHSDGNILWEAGISPVILGPGTLAAAHAPNESVSFSQVVQAAQIYLNLALAL